MTSHEEEGWIEVPVREKIASGPVPRKSSDAGRLVPIQAAPMYITIGPQCSGKTSLLREILTADLNRESAEGESACFSTSRSARNQPVKRDVAIDDENGVYFPLPVEYFLHPHRFPSGKVLHGRSLRDRVLDPSQAELRVVLSRLAGEISSKAELRRELAKNVSSKFLPPPPVLNELVEAVESVLLDSSFPSSSILPPRVDLYVVEAIFAGGALDAAQLRLRKLASGDSGLSTPVAWGNTNSRPREYEVALELAEASGRPVRFLVFSDVASALSKWRAEHSSSSASSSLSDADSPVCCNGAREETEEEAENARIDKQVDHIPVIPELTRQNIFRRNVTRLCRTGRYVNSKAINDTMHRTQDLLDAAIQTIDYNKDGGAMLLQKGEGCNIALEVSLAKLGGFKMDPMNRTVSRVRTPRNSTSSLPHSSAAAFGKGGTLTPSSYQNGQRGWGGTRGAGGRTGMTRGRVGGRAAIHASRNGMHRHHGGRRNGTSQRDGRSGGRGGHNAWFGNGKQAPANETRPGSHSWVAGNGINSAPGEHNAWGRHGSSHYARGGTREGNSWDGRGPWNRRGPPNDSNPTQRPTF